MQRLLTIIFCVLLGLAAGVAAQAHEGPHEAAGKPVIVPVFANQALHEALEAHPAVHHALEIGHIMGFVLLIGSIWIVDIRLLGLGRHLGVRALSGFVLPWTLTSLLLILPTGVILFAAHANELIGSRVFLAKMTLIFFAGMNALMFHSGPYQDVEKWDLDVQPPGGARACAVASILLWLAVIVAGHSLPDL